MENISIKALSLYQDIIVDLQKSEHNITRTTKNRWNKTEHILLVVICCIFFMTIPISFYIGLISSNPRLIFGVVISAITITAGMLALMVKIPVHIEGKSKREILQFIEKHRELLNEFNFVNSFDTIINKIDLLGSLMQVNLQEMKKHNLRIFNTFLNKEIEFCYLILTDLRSDLANRLTEQQQILEGAKSEVEKNIGGTTELESVSELQRARLDRQIEQFEELQKVLMKV